MKRILAVGVFLYAVALNVAMAQCLDYGPKVVALSGTITRATFAGPPNFASVADGDKAEIIWVLKLEKPVCVLAANEIDVREDNQKEVQLVLSPEQYKEYKGLVGQRVHVTGTLFHAITGHHFKTLLLMTSEISKKP